MRIGNLQSLNTAFPPAANPDLHGHPAPLSSLRDLNKSEAHWRPGSDHWAWFVLGPGKFDSGASIRLPVWRGSVLVEQEPNDTVNNLQHWDLKSADAGRFLAPRDADLFSFAVAVGENIRFKVRAREVSSPRDAFLQLERMNGTRLARARIDDRVETVMTNRFGSRNICSMD